MTINKEDITGIILAGGQGSRMGGKDKGQVKLHGKPMIDTVVERLTPQVSQLLISANRNLPLYEQLGYPVIQDCQNQGSKDSENQYEGPVAGILASLKALNTEFAVIVPCDAPLISPDLVTTLVKSYNQSQASLTLFKVGERLQPLFGLYQQSLITSLEAYYLEGNRKLMRWCQAQNPNILDFEGDTAAFSNINTPEELQKLNSRS